MSEPVLLVEKRGERATLTLNRPTSMNALSRELRREIAKTVMELEADPGVRVLILTGAGRAFCAGLDLKELGSGEGGVGADITSQVPEENPAEALARFSGPIIGAINGAAITGGFELALACDVLLASADARFADTHTRVGIMPGWGLSQKLSRAVGISRAKELSLTGNFLSADEATQWGLVNRVYAPDDLLPAAEKLADDMLSVDPTMLTKMKRLIDDGFSMSFADGMRLEETTFREVNAGVTAQSVEERREAVRQRGKSQATN